MSSSSYLALIAKRAASLNTLARWDLIRDPLYGWTAAGGSAYSIAWASQTHPSSLRADQGFYRELTGVLEGTTSLTLRANLAAVQANAGSYCWDGTTLSVRTTGGVNPNTLAFVAATFTLRFATSGLTFGGLAPWVARIDGSRLPTYHEAQPSLRNGLTQYFVGDLSLLNGSREFDYIAERYITEGSTITMITGGDDQPFADYEVGRTVEVIRPMTAGDDVAVLQLRSPAGAADRSLPLHTLSDYYGGRGTYGDGGHYLGLYWGDVDYVPLTFGTPGGGFSGWITGDMFVLSGSSITVTSVKAINRSTGATTTLTYGVDYLTNSLTGPEFAILIANGYTAAAYDLYASLSRSVRTAGAVNLELLRLAGVPDANLDLASFAQADLDCPQVLSLRVSGGPDFTQIVRAIPDLQQQIAVSTGADTTCGADGKWRCAKRDHSFTLSTYTPITDARLLACTPVDSVEQHPVAAVKVRYNRGTNADGSDAWETVTASSSEAAARLKKTETEVVDTCLRDLYDATVRAARLLRMFRAHVRQWDIETGIELFTDVVGSKERIVRAAGPSLTGTFDRVLQIESIDQQYGTCTVRARVNNMDGLDEAIKVICPTDIAYASATPEEKRQYLWITDTNDTIDGTAATHLLGGEIE